MISDSAAFATEVCARLCIGRPVCAAREQEILRLAREGLAGKDIAAALDIALATVNNHFRHIFDKLHVSSRTAAIHKYFHT